MKIECCGKATGVCGNRAGQKDESVVLAHAVSAGHFKTYSTCRASCIHTLSSTGATTWGWAPWAVCGLSSMSGPCSSFHGLNQYPLPSVSTSLGPI